MSIRKNIIVRKLHRMTEKYHLEKEVVFHGFQPPKNVRRFMEEADIFLFTSDYLEGWGAVLNESMNSACAVVAGHGIGAVPFLVQNEYNGLVYKTGRYKEFEEQVVRLVKDEELRKELGLHAYETMTKLWNPKEAAKRLYEFCEGILQGRVIAQEEGPLSIAPVIKPKDGYEYTRNSGRKR